MTFGYMAGVVRSLRRLLPLVVVFTAACEDPFGPRTWVATPDTVWIYSASRPEYLGFASAVDITSSPVLALPIEAPSVTGNWDFTIIEESGELKLAPASFFAGLESRARISELPNRTLESVTEASRDTTTYTVNPVPLVAGTVYVIRSRRASCGLSSGVKYAKLRPVEINEAEGTLRFEIVRNPYCDDRSFVPPED